MWWDTVIIISTIVEIFQNQSDFLFTFTVKPVPLKLMMGHNLMDFFREEMV